MQERKMRQRAEGSGMRWFQLTFLGLLLLACPNDSSAQPDRTRRIGVLATFEAKDVQGAKLLRALREGLQDQGWIEGQNLEIVMRFSASDPRSVGVLAEELAQQNVELVVSHGTPAVQAARRAVPNIPIVFATIGDPVAAGLVDSLARPGGNVTGLSLVASDLGHKRLEMLKEVVPGAKQVAILWNPTNASLASQVKEADTAARLLGLELIPISVERAPDLRPAVDRAKQAGVGAIITTSDSLQVNHRADIIKQAMEHNIPVVAEYREVVEAGALLSYGPSREDNWRRAAAYVSKILRGATPSDLPIEQPAKYELVVNLRTAQALGIDLSPVLFRADDVLE
jgi:putative tryptophan/tyrosine transport system substrate-binding protein